jgi:hypothetical protein
VHTQKTAPDILVALAAISLNTLYGEALMPLVIGFAFFIGIIVAGKRLHLLGPESWPSVDPEEARTAGHPDRWSKKRP